MKKKPVSLEAMMQGETSAAVGEGASVVQLPSGTPALSDPNAYQKMTVYVPKPAYKRLRQMALDHDRRINDFLQEAVDMMLEKYGQPSIREFKGQ